MRLLLLLLLLSSCATLNTVGMSEHCANVHNACLNSCPKSAPSNQWQIDTASCTDACNRQAKGCR
jgi:hypothetical protein